MNFTKVWKLIRIMLEISKRFTCCDIIYEISIWLLVELKFSLSQYWKVYLWYAVESGNGSLYNNKNNIYVIAKFGYLIFIKTLFLT